MTRPGCPLGGPRCPDSICDCFIDTHPDDPTRLHPEMFVVGAAHPETDTCPTHPDEPGGSTPAGDPYCPTCRRDRRATTNGETT